MKRIVIFIFAMLMLSACSEQQAQLNRIEKFCTQLDSGNTIDELNLTGISNSDLVNGINLYCPDYTTEAEGFVNDRN